MNKHLVSFVGYHKGKVQVAETEWIEHKFNIVLQAEKFKHEHKSKIDKVFIFVFDESEGEFIRMGAI